MEPDVSWLRAQKRGATGPFRSQMNPIQITYYFFNNNFNIILSSRGAQIFQKSRSHLKILGARRVMWSKFHNENPETLCATAENLCVTASWPPGVVHP
jgi:hypothetical protein